MGNVVIDSSGGGGWGDAIASGLKDWMGQRRYGQQQDAQQQAQEQDRIRREQEARDRAIAQQFLSLRPEQQNTLYPQLPEGARQYVMDPSSIPPAVPTPEEMFKTKVAKDAFVTFDTLPISARQAGTYQTAYGAAMPKETVEQQNANDVYAHPDSFAPPMQERQGIMSGTLMNAKDKEASVLARDKYTNIEVPGSKADIGLKGAQTTLAGAQAGQARAATGKISEETITERELRDPNSGASQTRAITAGRKSAAQARVDDLNEKLRTLTKERDEISMKLAGQQALATRDPKAKAGVDYLRAELDQRNRLINDYATMRDRVASGAAKAGVPITQEPKPQPASQSRPKANTISPQSLQSYSPDIEERITAAVKGGYSRDAAIQRLKDAGVIPK